MSGPGEVVVIGLGHPDRGDDAVGILVVERLAGHLPPGASAVTQLDDEAALLSAWEGADAAIVVDCALTADPVGTIRHLDALTEPLPVEPAASSHGGSLARAVALGRALDALPRHLGVYAVVGARLGLGEPMSPAVAAAVAPAADRIRAEVMALLCAQGTESDA
jgi:hydrogenase maturation protease